LHGKPATFAGFFVCFAAKQVIGRFLKALIKILYDVGTLNAFTKLMNKDVSFLAIER
jgi:hypothetical protein